MDDELKGIRAFFTERRLRCLSVTALEREAGLPRYTLMHFLNERRALNEKHIELLIPVLKDFGYNSDKE